MDNKYENDFQDVLQDPELAQELGADELAVHAAGLTIFSFVTNQYFWWISSENIGAVTSSDRILRNVIFFMTRRNVAWG